MDKNREGIAMKRVSAKKAKAVLAIAIAMAVAVTFMPMSVGTSYAASFSTSGAVSGLYITGTDVSSVSMAWKAYGSASGYQIYKARSKSGKYYHVKSLSSTSYTRTKLTTGLSCYYKVRAYRKNSDGSYAYSNFSSIVKGTPTLKTPVVSVTGTASSIKLRWAAVKGAKGYQIYRATSKNGTYKKRQTTWSPKYTNTSMTKNKAYYYKVRAYKKVDGKTKYGSFCEPLLGTTGPTQVSGVVAASASDSINLSWGAATSASGYEIWRATGSSSGSYTKVGTSAKTTFKDANVANGLTYYYKVRAYAALSGGNCYGAFNSQGYSRAAVVSTAVAWLGCKESNQTNKPIIALYNSNMGTNFYYKTAWCAMYVSAVAIKSGTTAIIVRGSYCPSIINTYKKSTTSKYKYAGGSKYVPKPGDVIFFDWNNNNVPDHTGLVASVSGSTIKTIEGNKSDAVGYRTFKVGYSGVLGYGLPNYDDANGVVYTGTSAALGCGELTEMGIGTEPEGYNDLGEDYEFVEEKVIEDIGVGCSEDVSEYDKMMYMLKRVRANAQPENADCTASQYYSTFLLQLCEEAGVEASIITVEDENGDVNAWVEATLDGKWYKIYPAEQDKNPEEFTPEATDIDESEYDPADYVE